MRFKIGKGITLREYLKDCVEDKPSSAWMIYDSSEYTLDMMVYPVILDDWDLEPEEYQKIEDEVLSQGRGYGNLMNQDQLVDIIENLAMQKPNYFEADLEAAFNFYDERDAFIQI